LCLFDDFSSHTLTLLQWYLSVWHLTINVGDFDSKDSVRRVNEKIWTFMPQNVPFWKIS